jgi:hypothetical protein
MGRHVFLSFVEEDLELVRLFRGQAKNEESDLGMELMEMVDTPGLQHERRPCERAAAGQDGQATPRHPAPC